MSSSTGDENEERAATSVEYSSHWLLFDPGDSNLAPNIRCFTSHTFILENNQKKTQALIGLVPFYN